MAICSKATRTCAYTRGARASGTTRCCVDLHCRDRAVLGHNIKSPGDLTVIRRQWATPANPRLTDVVRRLRIVVVTPEIFVKSLGLGLGLGLHYNIPSYDVLVICPTRFDVSNFHTTCYV